MDRMGLAAFLESGGGNETVKDPQDDLVARGKITLSFLVALVALDQFCLSLLFLLLPRHPLLFLVCRDNIC